MATIYALKTKGLLEDQSKLTIETKAGILAIEIKEQTAGRIYITMQHAIPQFEAFNGSKFKLAQSIGLTEDAIHPEFNRNCCTCERTTGAYLIRAAYSIFIA